MKIDIPFFDADTVVAPNAILLSYAHFTLKQIIPIGTAPNSSKAMHSEALFSKDSDREKFDYGFIIEIFKKRDIPTHSHGLKLKHAAGIPRSDGELVGKVRIDCLNEETFLSLNTKITFRYEEQGILSVECESNEIILEWMPAPKESELDYFNTFKTTPLIPGIHKEVPKAIYLRSVWEVHTKIINQCTEINKPALIPITQFEEDSKRNFFVTLYCGNSTEAKALKKMGKLVLAPEFHKYLTKDFAVRCWMNRNGSLSFESSQKEVEFKFFEKNGSSVEEAIKNYESGYIETGVEKLKKEA